MIRRIFRFDCEGPKLAGTLLACLWLCSGAQGQAPSESGIAPSGIAPSGSASFGDEREPTLIAPAGTENAAGEAAPNSTTAAEILPSPFQLTEQQEQHLGQWLDLWEQHSKKVKTFRCRFELLRYDTVFGPPNDPKTKSEGVIRYAAPDKGVFRVERIGEYTAPTEPSKPPTYAMTPVETAEHWVCDGSSVYEFDAKQKQLIQRKLPPSLQGKEIVDGPLPFIFGATRAKIESRYWIRQLPPPPGTQGEFWFEAFPKRREEAGNFQMVMVILSDKTFLPRAIQVFPPAYDPQKNRSREVFIFHDSQVNNVVDLSRDFLNQFISPNVPFGWKKVVQNFEAEGAPQVQNAERPGERSTR